MQVYLITNNSTLIVSEVYHLYIIVYYIITLYAVHTMRSYYDLHHLHFFRYLHTLYHTHYSSSHKLCNPQNFGSHDLMSNYIFKDDLLTVILKK